MSLPIRNAGTKEFDFTKLSQSGGSETLENRFLHVQVVSQPAWYAVMALPYLMEFPHECSEQPFNRYCANALARNIAGSDPKMRRIFDQWKAAGGKALDSPLAQNGDLKGMMLEETPWLREANNESEARWRVGLLFDDNHMERELEKALAKLSAMQGMFWKDNEGEGWWWWQAPIETQAMMIEAFREIDADEKAVDDCQVWLIKQKQVGDWKTTKATADAVHALLKGGKNLLGSDALLQVSLGGQPVKPEGVEAGTGFYESRFVQEAVKPELGKIALTQTDAGVSWASVHWRYLEVMAKVTSHGGKQLTLEKSLFLRKNADKGPVRVPVDGAVKVGDELVTRVILKNDRAMEYVHLKDLRGSGTELVNVLSGYRWQDGFGNYEVRRDTASHFFIGRLPPGTHVFETSVRVQHAGK